MQLSLDNHFSAFERQHITADFDNNRFELSWLTFDQAMNDLVKAELGAEFDRPRKIWWCSRSQTSVNGLNRLGVTFTAPAQEAIMWLEFDIQSRSEASSAFTSDFKFDWPGLPFREYQFAGIDYLNQCKHGLLTDDQGLGKTLTVLGLLYYNNAYPLLISCPAKLKGLWYDEITLPEKANIQGKEIFVVNSIADIEHECQDQLKLFSYDFKCPGCRFERADIVITNPDQYSDGWINQQKKIVKLSALAERLRQRKFKMVVYDEIHSLKNWDSQRTIAVKAATRGAEFQIGLSGTPIVNNLDELACELSVIEALHHFGGWLNFKSDFVDDLGYFWIDERGKRRKRTTKDMDLANDERRKGLNEKLRQTCMLRRRKVDVLKDLPPKIRQTYYVEIDNHAEYQQAEDKLLDWVRERVLIDRKFLESISQYDERTQKYLIRQRQDEKAESAERGEYMVRLQALRRVTGEGKLAGIKEWIDRHRLTGEKLLVFGIHATILESLLSWYPKCARITANMSEQDIRDNKKLFQEDPNCWLIVLAHGPHVGASPGGVGHTLTAGSHVLFCELGWSWAHIVQAEDRAHRLGSETYGHESINIYHLLGRTKGRNTIEVEMAALIDEKRKLAEAVQDGLSAEDGGVDGIIQSLTAQIERELNEVAA